MCEETLRGSERETVRFKRGKDSQRERAPEDSRERRRYDLKGITDGPECEAHPKELRERDTVQFM
ncbi:hypothetical protein NBO_468g0002 [Nosema bombycis CQ1]|uniref:Uncharacterized protein n=1 Tax=Nosema bombycis (strain CQ1 / CVCC 102059) TaxID=578461 RepID=R0MDZ3_NOSB1|nr:hypothetical protein NBO_468g0002 [Nosema bombycis CQ1]|eukprot:EOB12295.1 hypothetical protein NBO_468g0002 [Nosema bombycis CQ1]